MSDDDEQSTMFSFVEDGVCPCPNEVVVELSDEQMEYVEKLAEARAKSYIDGRTGDDAIGDHTSTSVHVEGLKGELAVSITYGDGTVDESISDKGDDGIDVEVEIDGDTYSADVKTTTYDAGGDSWLMQKVKGLWNPPEVFFVCYVNDNVVKIRGWAAKDELCQESNIEPSPAGGDWDNYILRSGEYRELPPVELGEQISVN